MARIRTEVDLDEAVLRQAQTAAKSSGHSRSSKTPFAASWVDGRSTTCYIVSGRPAI